MSSHRKPRRPRYRQQEKDRERRRLKRSARNALAQLIEQKIADLNRSQSVPVSEAIPVNSLK